MLQPQLQNTVRADLYQERFFVNEYTCIKRALTHLFVQSCVLKLCSLTLFFLPKGQEQVVITTLWEENYYLPLGRKFEKEKKKKREWGGE